MSFIRNNKKKRLVKSIILIYAEGKTEYYFLKHLRQKYCRDTVTITIKKGNGGSPKKLVIDTKKVVGDYLKRYVLCDSDRPEIDDAEKYATDNNIKILKSPQCFDVLILQILDKKITLNLKSQQYKDQLSNICNMDNWDDMKMHQKFFPKTILENKRKKLPLLKKLIDIIIGKTL